MFVEDFGAAARFGRAGFAFAEADRAVVDEIAEGEHGQHGEDGGDDRPRSAADQAGDLRPAPCASPRPAEPRAGQKARGPRIESRAGSRVSAAASITAIPIASTGPSQWVDSRSASSSTSIAAITVAAEAAIGRTLSASAAGSAASGSPPRPSSSR